MTMKRRSEPASSFVLRPATLGFLLVAAASIGDAREADFNLGWKFSQGDHPGVEQLAFDDRDWQVVRTPHDWAIAGPFDSRGDGETGKLPWRGVGWYRKWLMVDRREEGSQVYLDFDGVMAAPQVYVNGNLAGSWDYGYTPFRIDITPYVRFGRANVVSVRIDTTKMRSRWYPGAGIYRKVKLVVSPPAHLAHDGTRVTTPKIDDDTASVVVENEIDNHLDRERAVEVLVRLHSPDGAVLEERVEALTLDPDSTAASRLEFEVAEARRWDIDDPVLYTAVTELRVGDAAVDRRETRFGIRSFQFTPDDGFWLNGRRVELRGVNLHHDLGPLGAAFNRDAARRQLDILQVMGVNAIRTAHNPPAAEFLDLCDERGLILWDELFDKWDATAGRIDGEPSFESHIDRHAASLVRRDRNHPSVFVWSIGNEILNQPHDPEGKSRERVRYARDVMRRHDDSRPVALGCFIPETALSDTLADLDLTGWNYQRRYALFRDRFPSTPILYSESASAVSTRGWYDLPLPTTKCEYSDSHQVTAFELSAAPWADLPEVELERLRRDRYLAGEFIWSGFDYLGEPTPFSPYARSSYFGVIDLVGLPKDRYYLYRSQWRPDEPTVHLAPHWNWPDHVGEDVPVTVYTNGDEAELFVNGQSVGRRRKGDAPPTPKDLAVSATATASSMQSGRQPSDALGLQREDRHEGWRPDGSDSHPWLEVDLGETHELRSIVMEFPRESQLYGYRLEASEDGQQWTTLNEHAASEEPRWGGVKEAVLRVETRARRLRVTFEGCLPGVTPALNRFSVYESPYESAYYAPTYDYRVRWNEVRYEPGELRAVAYKKGVKIGEASVVTAGEPHHLELTADDDSLCLNGEDLVFITAVAVDEAGNPCPRADDWLRIGVEGPIQLAGAGNGNPLSMDPFQDDRVQLFNGKAVLVIRGADEELGPATVEVESDTLCPTTLSIKTEPAERCTDDALAE